MKLYLFLLLSIFGIGAFLSTYFNTQRSLKNINLQHKEVQNIEFGFVIDGEEFTTKDVAFEKSILAFQYKDLDIKGQIREDELNLALVQGIMERKILYKFIHQDSLFNLEDPVRYVSCVESWRDFMNAEATPMLTAKDQVRLKNLLCELDVISQYWKEVFEPKISITPEEMQAYFKTNIKTMREKQKISIQQVLLPRENDAKEIRKQINHGNFAALAREHSISPESEKGGRLPDLAQDEIPRVFDIAFNMKIGEISGVLNSPYGFHIIMPMKIIPSKQLTFEESAPRITHILIQKKSREVYRQWIENALEAVKVSFKSSNT